MTLSLYRPRKKFSLFWILLGYFFIPQGVISHMFSYRFSPVLRSGPLINLPCYWNEHEWSLWGGHSARHSWMLAMVTTLELPFFLWPSILNIEQILHVILYNTGCNFHQDLSKIWDYLSLDMVALEACQP